MCEQPCAAVARCYTRDNTDPPRSSCLCVFQLPAPLSSTEDAEAHGDAMASQPPTMHATHLSKVMSAFCTQRSAILFSILDVRRPGLPLRTRNAFTCMHAWGAQSEQQRRPHAFERQDALCCAALSLGACAHSSTAAQRRMLCPSTMPACRCPVLRHGMMVGQGEMRQPHLPSQPASRAAGASAHLAVVQVACPHHSHVGPCAVADPALLSADLPPACARTTAQHSTPHHSTPRRALMSHDAWQGERDRRRLPRNGVLVACR